MLLLFIDRRGAAPNGALGYHQISLFSKTDGRSRTSAKPETGEFMSETDSGSGGVARGEAERLRLFIAISLPEEVKTGIEKAQAELRRAVPEGQARWTRREQFHLTLRFLGSVEARRVEALTEAVRGACRGFAPLQLRAEAVGFFPNNRLPRVVWAGIEEGQGQLAPLQRAVQAATLVFTAEEPEERFSGHVTLARLKGIKRSEAEGLARAASVFAQKRFGEWTAREVELVRSELSPKGARYTCLAAAPLLAAG